MKKLVLLAVLLVSLSVIAVAQDVPTAEIFGGFSYFRCDTLGADVSCNLKGWDAAVDLNVNKYAGVAVDLSGVYGNVGKGAASADIKAHSFMVGPRFTLRRNKFTPFGQLLFGISHINTSGGAVTTNNFAMAFGGGVDINLNEKIAVRPAQVDLVVIRNGPDFLKNFRYSAGVVFKLGKR